MRIILMILISIPFSLANAGIFKCVVNGETSYQSKPCPANAELKSDVSHLKSQSQSYSDNRLKFEQRQYDDYRQDRRQSREDIYKENFLRERRREANRRKYERAISADRARQQSYEVKAAKAERDRQWRIEKDKRKARNNGSYRYYDINHN